MRELVNADSASLPTASSAGGEYNPRKRNRFPPQPPLYSAAAENVGPEARRVGMLGGHTQVSKSVDDGGVEA